MIARWRGSCCGRVAFRNRIQDARVGNPLREKVFRSLMTDAVTYWTLDMSVGELARISGGQLISGEPSAPVAALIHDSREVAPGRVFLAIRGERFDGHAYVGAVAAAGATGAIVQSHWTPDAALPESFALIQVDEPLAALRRLAAFHRRTLKGAVVAVAGSAGKSTTKELIARLLSDGFRTHKTWGNFNNLIGAPLALLEMPVDAEAGVFELGMNQPGELRLLTEMVAPNLAVLTNVGKAHVGMFDSDRGLLEAKGEFVDALPAEALLVHNGDCERSQWVVDRYLKERAAISVGYSESADARISDVQSLESGYRFNLIFDGKECAFTLPCYGRYNVINAAMAVVVGCVLGAPMEALARAMASFEGMAMRSQVLEMAGRWVVMDCYNASPDGMLAAIESLALVQTAGRRIAVLGDMLELGDESETQHRRVGEAFERWPLDLFVAVGPEMTAAYRAALGVGQTALCFEGVSDATAFLVEAWGPGDWVLVKGSRGMGMEAVVEGLRAAISGTEA